jgi:hypothetical protein
MPLSATAPVFKPSTFSRISALPPTAPPAHRHRLTTPGSPAHGAHLRAKINPIRASAAELSHVSRNRTKTPPVAGPSFPRARLTDVLDHFLAGLSSPPSPASSRRVSGLRHSSHPSRHTEVTHGPTPAAEPPILSPSRSPSPITPVSSPIRPTTPPRRPVPRGIFGFETWSISGDGQRSVRREPTSPLPSVPPRPSSSLGLGSERRGGSAAAHGRGVGSHVRGHASPHGQHRTVVDADQDRSLRIGGGSESAEMPSISSDGDHTVGPAHRTRAVAAAALRLSADSQYVSPAPPARSPSLASLCSHTVTSPESVAPNPVRAPSVVTTPSAYDSTWDRTPPARSAVPTPGHGAARASSVLQSSPPRWLEVSDSDSESDDAPLDLAVDAESLSGSLARAVPAGRSALDRFMALAALPRPKKPPPGPIASAFTACCGRLAKAYLTNPCEETLLAILAVPKLGLLAGAAGSVYKRLRIFPNVDWPDSPPPPSFVTGATDGDASAELEEAALDDDDDPLVSERSQRSRIKAAVQAVEEGFIGRAVRILTEESSVAPLTADTVRIMQDKHPRGQSKPFSKSIGNPPAGGLPDAMEVSAAFRSIPSDTASGLSGWSPLLVRLASRNDDFEDFLVKLTGQVVQGTAPGKQMLCASLLMGLTKPNGDLRPIAIPELFYRGVMKCAAKKYVHARSLAPFQYGVGTPGGVETIIHTIEEALDSAPGTGYTHLVQLDFKNAFNSIPRKCIAQGLLKNCPSLFRAARWAYHEPTPLVMCQNGSMVVLESSEGVRQGDPIGPFCWSVGARKQLEYVVEAVPGIAASAYMDDVTVLGSRPGLLKEIAQALQDAPVRAVSLNLSKSSEHLMEDIRARGLRLLGTCVGSENARREFLIEKIRSEKSLLQSLSDLPHQHGLLVLRFSVQQNLRHLARSLDPSGLWDLWEVYDKLLHATVARFRDASHSLRTDHVLFSLPVRMGGLGVPSFGFVIPHARFAMKELASHTIADRHGFATAGFPQRQRQLMQPIWDETLEQLLQGLTHEQRLLVVDSSSKVGCKWLTSIPYFGTLRLSNKAVSCALHYRTLCPSRGAICPSCAKDNLPGHDELCAMRANYRLARHEIVKKVLVSHLRSVEGCTVEVEPMVPGSGLRTDFRVTGPAAHSGVASEYDLTIVAPTSVDALRFPARVTASSSSTPLQDVVRKTLRSYLTDVSEAKRKKYDGRTVSRFAPLAMTSGGTLSRSSRIVFAHWRSLSPAPFPFLLSHLSVLLVRARAENFNS